VFRCYIGTPMMRSSLRARRASSLRARRAMVASLVTTVQLLAVAWVPVAHAQLAYTESQPAFEQAHTSDCLYVHGETLCATCAASNLVAATPGSAAQIPDGGVQWQRPQIPERAAQCHLLSRSEAARAPPSSLSQ
jgi:hypothetical protein